MSDFEKYIEAKYPNRSPKILFQKFKDIDGTLFYGIKEVEDQAEAWKQPTSTLTVTHIKNFAVAAIDDSGQKFVGNYGCFTLIKRGASDQHLPR